MGANPPPCAHRLLREGSDGRRIAEYNETSGALIREYVWNGWEPVAVIEGGVISFVRADHIDRPVFATNAAGTKVWSATYQPFGGVHLSTGTLPTNRFPGQWFQSESGLHQNWMRDYDPTTGRYLQPDPLGLVDGASVYGYVGQNPGVYSDPTGLCFGLLLAVCPAIPPTGDPNWEPYYGDPYWFHCGFDGYLEKRSPTPDDPIAECFYDNGRLVDRNHPYPSCGGTPDQYGKDSPLSHTFRDSGGIAAEGWGAFHESQRYFSDREREMCGCEPDVIMPWGY